MSLQVLVLTGGAADTATGMVKAGLDEGLVPYTEVDLTASSRPIITDAFLIDTTQSGYRRARYQAVVMQNNAPDGLSEAEKQALIRFEREFKIRQFDAYVSPSAAVGLSAPIQGGTLDGATATITSAGRSTFSYLQGQVPFEDLDPNTFETYAYVASPEPPPGTTFTSYLEATIPGTSARGTILGVFTQDGREEMVLTVAINQYQKAQKALFPGILNWLTYGVHLGMHRLYFTVHIDDVFMEDGRWDDTLKCTLNEDCPNGEKGKGIIMSVADVDYLVAWQERQGMKLDILYNGGAYFDYLDEHGTFPAGQRLLINKQLLRWTSHTYNHMFLGCLRDRAGMCALDARGQVQWPAYEVVRDQIAKNITFAAQVGIKIDPGELVTGEHSGLRRPASEPSDNPNLVRALNELKIEWAGSDSSVEFEQRTIVGNTLSVPRYPMNIFYNVGTKEEEIQEYNWIYASRADRGSGLCEGRFTCLPPLDVRTGFDNVIVPREVRQAFMHMVANDPRPHYAHQSNLAEDRILYPVVDGVLDEYRRIFNTALVPFSNPTLKESGVELRTRAAYKRSRARVDAYVQGGNLVVSVTGSGTENPVPVPVTAPTNSASLSPYWGLRNGWQNINAGRSVQIPLANTVQYAR